MFRGRVAGCRMNYVPLYGYRVPKEMQLYVSMLSCCVFVVGASAVTHSTACLHVLTFGTRWIVGGRVYLASLIVEIFDFHVSIMCHMRT